MTAPPVPPPPAPPPTTDHPGPVRELLGARELLRNLTVRELKVRYKRSALGFLWTLLNPLLMMAVFTAIFSTLFKADIDRFWLYFLTGYLPFAFFQASAQVATGSVVGNSNLVKKVYFPRAVLPLAVVLSQAVHLLLGLAVLLVAEAVTGHFDWILYLPMLVVAIVLLAMFSTGLAMLLAGANAFVRDIQEFTTVAFLMWFYATPVIYPLKDGGPLPSWVQNLIRLNPLTEYVQLFRSALYDYRWPGLPTLLGACVASVLMLSLGWTVFNRLAPRFAKEV